MSALLSFAISIIGCYASYSGSTFVQYEYYNDWQSNSLYCTDNAPCTVNCFGFTACSEVDIYGPKDSSLTINCNGNYQNNEGSQACVRATIYAQNSTVLYINAYNDDYQMYGMNIYTPTNNVVNTFVTCGIIGTSNSKVATTEGCLESNHIYSINGFINIEWTYSESSIWTMTPNTNFPDTMHCGIDYLSSCSPFVLGTDDMIHCADSSECNEGTFSPTSPTTPPTTYNPTSPTINPTTMDPSYATTTSTLSGWDSDSDHQQSGELDVGIVFVIAAVCILCIVGVVYLYRRPKEEQEQGISTTIKTNVNTGNNSELSNIKTVNTANEIYVDSGDYNPPNKIADGIKSNADGVGIVENEGE